MKDITGQKFNMLTAIKFIERRNNETYWLFKCDCGNQKVIRAAGVSNGKTNSCGCMNGNIKDLKNKRFGRLTVINMIIDRVSNGSRLWLCKCDCGNKHIVSGGNLTSGSTRSCGCLAKENLKKQQEKTHGMTKTRQYRIWQGMKQRCTNIKNKDYKNYGGRGIKLLIRWQNFENFWEDMQGGYSDKLTIDRINNNGNYCKTNCRWATIKEQVNNTRTNKLITYKGKTQTQSQWSKKLGIHRCVLAHRLKTGWGIPSSFETPVLKYNMKKL